MSNSFHFSEQDNLESTRALETMLRILSDFFDDHLFKHPGFTIANATGDSGIFRETFPYFVHMTYVILLEMKEHSRFDRPPTAPASSPLEKEVEALWSILNFSAEHWQIARKLTIFPLVHEPQVALSHRILTRSSLQVILCLYLNNLEHKYMLLEYAFSGIGIVIIPMCQDISILSLHLTIVVCFNYVWFVALQ